MNYLQLHRSQGHKSDKKRRVLFVIAAASLFVITVFSFVPGLFSSTAHAVASPVWSLNASAGGVFSFFSFTEEEREQVEEMRERLDTYSFLATDNEMLKRENDELREALSMRPREDAIAATVVARPPQAPYDVLIIDGGSDQGIDAGDRVFYGETVLLGEVEEVFARSARVSLFSSAGHETDIFIDEHEELFTAEGRGGGMLRVNVPRNEDVSESRYLLNSGERLSLLAEVVHVAEPETGPFKVIEARVPVDIFSLRRVFVVPDNADDI